MVHLSLKIWNPHRKFILGVAIWRAFFLVWLHKVHYFCFILGSFDRGDQDGLNGGLGLIWFLVFAEKWAEAVGNTSSTKRVLGQGQGKTGRMMAIWSMKLCSIFVVGQEAIFKGFIGRNIAVWLFNIAHLKEDTKGFISRATHLLNWSLFGDHLNAFPIWFWSSWLEQALLLSNMSRSFQTAFETGDEGLRF